jgi:diacylglycerol kinase (ATP)
MAALPLLQLVRNPCSGSYNPRVIEALAKSLRAQGFQVELATSSARESFVPDPEAAHVCVAGGDGTVRHVAAVLAQLAKPPGFSVYPMGTINLVAREWEAPRDPAAFARHVVEQKNARTLAIVNVNDTYCVACASIGPDAQAVSFVSDALKVRIGRLAYAVSLSRALIHWSPPKLEVVIDGTAYECGALYISNGRYFAGSWVIAPKAALGDPSVQVTMLLRARRADFLIFMMAVIVGRVSSLPNIRTVEARSISITADREFILQLDGDEGSKLPAAISVSDVLLKG